MMAHDVESLLIGSSAPMRQLRALVARIAATALPVIIEGETGSGKELVARALHHGSGRAGSLVAVNVCAVSDSMFEASMFGHVRGAFTGAVRDAAGYLTEAHCGTLFLDEIGGLSPANQAKLLRALETKQFRPVGGRTDQPSDFRLIAASNEEIGMLVSQGRFRADLAHRLNGLRIHVPPLRARLEDVPLLASYFAAWVLGDQAKERAIGAGALRALQAHSWPGNVRELRHVIEASIVLSSGEVREEDVLALIAPADSFVERRRQRQGYDLLTQLDRCAWDVSEVASTLGVHRATVYRRLKRMRIAELAAKNASVTSQM